MFTRKCALGPGHELDPDLDFRFIFDVAGEGGGVVYPISVYHQGTLCTSLFQKGGGIYFEIGTHTELYDN